MSNTRRGVATLAAGLALVAGLSGCSKEVEANKVEDELQSVLQERAKGMKIEDPECDEDLKAEVGETTDCKIEVNGSKQKFKAKVTSVEGETVKFDFVKD